MSGWNCAALAVGAAWLLSAVEAASGPPDRQRSVRPGAPDAWAEAGAGPSSAASSRNALGPIIPIAFSANDETDPAIAYNPDRDEYLAIWDDNTLNAIRGVMLNPDGTIKGEPFFVIPPAPGEGDIHGMTLLYHPGVQRMFAFGIREEPGGSRAIGVIESAARDWGAVLNLTNLGVYVSAFAVARLTDNNLQFLVACTFAGVTNLFRSTLGPTLMPIGSPIQTTFFNNPPGEIGRAHV